MTKSKTSSSASASPSNGSPLPQGGRTEYPHLSEQLVIPKKRSRNSPSKTISNKGKHRSRRDELLRRLDIDVDLLAEQPQISPLMKRNGIKVEQMVDVLRCDVEHESMSFVKLYDSLTPASRSLAGVEAIAMGAQLTPRRLWELFCGATLIQGKESVEMTIALALPDIMRVTVKNAKKVKGQADREHIYKAARILPTPKGSTTNINVGQPKEMQEAEDTAGELESADEFMMKTSRLMYPSKALPAPSEIIDVEDSDEPESEG